MIRLPEYPGYVHCGETKLPCLLSVKNKNKKYNPQRCLLILRICISLCVRNRSSLCNLSRGKVESSNGINGYRRRTKNENRKVSTKEKTKSRSTRASGITQKRHRPSGQIVPGDKNSRSNSDLHYADATLEVRIVRGIRVGGLPRKQGIKMGKEWHLARLQTR